MKTSTTIIFILLMIFLTGCVYHPQFWDQEPRPHQYVMRDCHDSGQGFAHRDKDSSTHPNPDGNYGVADPNPDGNYGVADPDSSNNNGNDHQGNSK